jgi:hypothetical protein
MSGQAVIAAYHDLWQVQASFRMAKSDLKARPVGHHQREATEAHLSVVFAALAVARHLQDTTGVTIKKLLRALEPLHTGTVDIAGHELTAETTPSADAAEILAKLPSTG